MKKIMFFSLFACLSIGAVMAQATTGKVLRHVVLFKFKDSASAASVKTVEDAFLLLPSKIKLIKGFEWGLNSSPEKINEGFTHCYTVTFGSNKDRDAYLVHPDHKAFVKILQPFIDKALVVDYWVK